MVSLPSVLIDALWIIGLAVLLTTISYASWYKGVKDLRWGHIVSLPRTLMPFCMGLTVFCAGMALNGRSAQAPVVWWETIVWSVLFALFAAQVVMYARAGMHHGWDTPVEGKRNDRA